MTWDLTSSTALSQRKRDQKEDKIKELNKQLADLEKKLTQLRLTKMNVKLHME